jgi:hypothetical protein
MAKSQTNAATDASNTLISQANQQLPPVIQGLQNQQNTAIQRQTDLYNQALGGFQQQQTTGGYDPTQLASLRQNLAGMQATGGFDPTQLASIRQQYGQVGNELSGFLPSGGMDPAQLAAINAGYGGLASTGGYTPAMQQQFMQQATDPSRALAANLTGAAQRSAAAGGGGGGAAEAAIANIQGTLGDQAAVNARNAALGLNQQITQNRLAGLSGLTGVQGQLQQGRLGITGQQTGLGTAQAGLEGAVAGARQGVAGLQSGLESGVAQGVQRANVGIQGLFDTQTGAVSDLGKQVLAGLGLQYGTEAQGAQILQELSKNPGLFQTGFQDFVNLLGALP